MKNKFFNLLSLLLFSIHLSAQCDPEQVPTAQCVPGLVVQILAINDCTIELSAQNFNDNSFDDTTPSEGLIFYFNDNPEDFAIEFDGSNIGINDIIISVQDTDGCVSTCSSYLFVASDAICHNIPEYSLFGNVSTIQDEGIKDVEINLNGVTTSFTSTNGSYDCGFTAAGSYTMSCYKNDNPSNGVTGADLIILRQHILTITLIENPIYLLAADVNNNGAITTADLVAARQVILGNSNSFPNNTSWRFYHEDIETGEIFETFNFNYNGGDFDQINWTGYKVGDVNGNAEPE